MTDILPGISRAGAPERTLLLVGDLHLTDGSLLANPVQPAGVKVIRDVSLRVAAPPIDVLFMGDGVDLLRSRLWDGAVKPWHPPGPEQEAVVESIVSGAIRLHRPLLAGIRRFLQLAGGRVYHLYGNHDRHLAFYPRARARLSAALTGDPHKVQFAQELSLPEYRLYAHHGHLLNPVYQGGAHDAPIGDALTVVLQNRFPDAVAEALGAGRDLADRLHLLNWVAPQRATVDYLFATLNRYGEPRRVKTVWNELVEEFLTIPRVQEWIEAQGGTLRAWRRGSSIMVGLRATTLLPLSWMDFLRRVLYNSTDLDQQDHNLAAAAGRYLARSQNAETDFVACGHTHIPGMMAVGEGPRGSRYYLNTGAWIMHLTAVAGAAPERYSRQEELTFVLLTRSGADGLINATLHRTTRTRDR